MGVILYIWQKGGLCVQEPGIKPSVLFPQTMISRFNLVPCRHFHYLFLIENLFDSCFGKVQSICGHLCMINYTCRGIPSTFTSSVGRSYTSKSLDLFYFMDSKAASLICPLGTLQNKNYICMYEQLSFDRQNESFSLKRFFILFANTRTCNLRPQCLLH